MIDRDHTRDNTQWMERQNGEIGLQDVGVTLTKSLDVMNGDPTQDSTALQTVDEMTGPGNMTTTLIQPLEIMSGDPLLLTMDGNTGR